MWAGQPVLLHGDDLRLDGLGRAGGASTQGFPLVPVRDHPSQRSASADDTSRREAVEPQKLNRGQDLDVRFRLSQGLLESQAAKATCREQPWPPCAREHRGDVCPGRRAAMDTQ